MNIKEIENTLTNGFHDSRLTKVQIDYEKREAQFHMLIEMSDPESGNDKLENVYREGNLIVSELLFCVIEPPDPKYPYKKAEGQWITDSGSVKSAEMKIRLPSSLPEGAFIHYFFIADWNAFIYLAALDARFQWK